MSTRSTLAYVEEGQTVMHLYKEMHDDMVHLAIAKEDTNIELNLVVPSNLVDGVTAILKRADTGEPK